MNFYPGQIQWSEVERLEAANKQLRKECKRLRGVLLVIAKGHYSGPYCEPAGAIARDGLREDA